MDIGSWVAPFSFAVVFFIYHLLKRRDRKSSGTVDLVLELEVEDPSAGQEATSGKTGPRATKPSKQRSRTGASLERSAKERSEWVGDRTGQPPTELMVAAVKRLGFNTDGMDFEQASKLLSIRDYVFTLVNRTPQQETSRQIRALINDLLKDQSVHESIRKWSWHTRNHDIRRIPRDQLRTRCENFLKKH